VTRNTRKGDRTAYRGHYSPPGLGFPRSRGQSPGRLTPVGSPLPRRVRRYTPRASPRASPRPSPRTSPESSLRTSPEKVPATPETPGVDERDSRDQRSSDEPSFGTTTSEYPSDQTLSLVGEGSGQNRGGPETVSPESPVAVGQQVSVARKRRQPPLPVLVLQEPSTERPPSSPATPSEPSASRLSPSISPPPSSGPGLSRPSQLSRQTRLRKSNAVERALSRSASKFAGKVRSAITKESK